MNLIQVDGANLGDDGDGKFQLRLGISPEPTLVGFVGDHGELKGIVFHEAPQEQGCQGNEHQDHYDDGTATTLLHGREAPERLMGMSMTAVDLSDPRAKSRWTRAGCNQAVLPSFCFGSSSTLQVFKVAS